jgi:hypothetical protein
MILASLWVRFGVSREVVVFGDTGQFFGRWDQRS